MSLSDLCPLVLCFCNNTGSELEVSENTVSLFDSLKILKLR